MFWKWPGCLNFRNFIIPLVAGVNILRGRPPSAIARPPGRPYRGRMRIVLSVLLCAAAACAWAQPASAPSKAPAARAACADCGVVRSVRPVSKELQPSPADEGKPSGLIATIPLGPGESRAGSSSRIGKDAPNVLTRWEVVVLLDDGRLRLLMLDARPEIAKGDRVRVEDGRLVRQSE